MRLVLFVGLILSVPALWAAPTILVLGDSISAAYGIPYDSGWVTQLQARLEKGGHPHRIINASISGETTAGGRSRLPQLLQQHQPDITVVELGGNDGLRGLSLKQVETNLVAMVQQAKQAGSQVLLLGMRLPPNYGPRYNLGFTQLYIKVAQSERVALVPFLLEGFATDPDLMQDDGIHPREAAQPLMLAHVWSVLMPLLNQ